MTKRNGFIAGFLVLICMMFLSADLFADMTVEQITENYRRHYERSIEGIDDYVVVTDMMTSYFKKDYIDGRPYFKSRVEFADPDMSPVTGITDNELFSPEMYDALSEHARYEGTAELDGYNTYVLYIDELEDFFADYDLEGADIKYARIYIDSENWVLRKMEFEIDFEEDRVMRTMNQTVKMEDYRDIEGMMVPYRTVVRIEGLAGHMTDEEREEALRGLREMEMRMEQMPDEERKMMERMMGPQLEEYRKMIESDRMEMAVTINEVRVNTGLTDDFFEE